ncbi:hypothetical protein QM787_22305 [Rhodococcus ruber]|uniref:DUF6545 domain-containing protein n=2 Tax=Rhodococcus ruber TaxID=1830 RepID=A0A098BFH9_9NOCA|nr:DUF6545 domain-containing protein [Rhodococcus ruber]ETT25814.1 hypothetical protein RR21198_3559 [Rhodococcus rhodochrous ATCC 21198]MCD2129533.1 hypothetical protein [Rhodococcus ruber]MCZ4505423.1 hypothetical protein [Rhodococcus ruber]MCZ4623007.1 hypothetical protein [Rhodococcus ruber]MDI9984330.1 hypothetical protein [Rhodococcus ruber]
MSALLHQEATSALPEWASIPMMGFLALVIGARALFVYERQLDQQITWLLVWWLGASLLRDGAVQTILLGVTPLTLSDIRLLTHGFAMLGAAAIVLIVLAYRKVRKIPRRTIVGCYALIVGWMLVMAWISAPARSMGVAIEELRSVRTVAYMAIYAAQMPLAVAAVAYACLRILRDGEQNRSTRLWAGLILGTGAVSAFDHLTRFANAVLMSVEVTNGFTDWRSQSNDVLFLPTACVLAAVVAAPVLAAVRAKLHNDPSSVAVLTLTPMWQDLSTALPAMSIESTGLLPNSVDREHRMRIECEDAVFTLLPYMTEQERREEATPMQRCAAIVNALERRRAGAAESRVATPRWLADEDELLRIAQTWTKRPAEAVSV